MLLSPLKRLSRMLTTILFTQSAHFRYVYPQPLDKLFFESMKVIITEVALPGPTARFTIRFARSLESAPGGRVSYFVRLMSYMRRYSRRLGIVLAVWLMSYLPVVGRLVGFVL
jgi:hypothetical protein